MSWLSVFKKIGKVAENPLTRVVVTAANPVAGLILTTTVQAVHTVQEQFPGDDDKIKKLRKSIVMDIIKSQHDALGVQYNEAQVNILVEGFLDTMKKAAAVSPEAK